MTDQEASAMLEELQRHYGQRVAPVGKYCDALRKFLTVGNLAARGLSEAVVRDIRYTIVGKSCLLDRMLYGGEDPSEVPCPVHKGTWSGIHVGWPGQRFADGRLAEPDPMLQAWYDAGCRCFQHSCSCTTGWQPTAR